MNKPILKYSLSGKFIGSIDNVHPDYTLSHIVLDNEIITLAGNKIMFRDFDGIEVKNIIMDGEIMYMSATSDHILVENPDTLNMFQRVQ
jgi:hypothetical protein